MRDTVRMREQGGATPSPRSMLRHPEVRALLASYGLSVLGDQVARIAVALLVYERSRSALAAAAVFACSFLPVLLGGPLLSALADRHPRRGVMVACDLTRAALVLGLLVPGLPLLLVFALLLAVGVLEPPFDSARVALLADVLQDEAYVVGNALMHVVVQSAQVAGYVLGGLLVAAVGVSGALTVDAGTFAVSAVIALLVLQARPGGQAPGERASLLADTAGGLRYVAAEPDLRRLLVCAVLGTAVVIVPEGLAVPTAAALHAGSGSAGLLTATLPAGFVLGSWLLLRFPPRDREALLRPLLVASCLPLLLTPFSTTVPGTALLWTATGAASCLQVVANASYVARVPAGMRARAFGVAGTVLTAAQGVVVLAAGGLAGVLGPRPTVAVAALCVLLLVASGAAVQERRAGRASAVPGTARTRDAHG